MLEIIQVSTRRQLKQFIHFPFSLYQDNPFWVPPLIADEWFTLDKKKNPAFAFSDAAYWLAVRDGRVVGRIAGIISHAYIKKWGNRYARFGWFDFVDDREVSTSLLQTVENWARSYDLTGLHGPLGFCDLDKEGMLVEGFDQMGTFISIYNHSYYPEHLEALGFVKDADWVEWDIHLNRPEQMARMEALGKRAAQKYGMRMVPLKRRKDVIPWVKPIFSLMNQGYEQLYATIPVTEEQVDCYVKQFFGFVNPDYISIIVDKEEKLVGFGINLPSLTRAAQKSRGRLFPFGFFHWLRAIRHNDTLDLYLVAVRPELRKTGIPFIMLAELTKVALGNGITHAIASPELETNTAVQSMWRSYDSHIHRRRRAYLKTWHETEAGREKT